MSENEQRTVSAERVIHADAAAVFEMIADPAQQPRWDGNGNLVEAAPGQRVRGAGDVFVMRIHTGEDRENHVVEFEEGRRIAWRPSPVGAPEPGHLWRWELEPLSGGDVLVRHTYDWTDLSDPQRFDRARKNTPEALQASIDRLAEVAEGASQSE